MGEEEFRVSITDYDGRLAECDDVSFSSSFLISCILEIEKETGVFVASFFSFFFFCSLLKVGLCVRSAEKGIWNGQDFFKEEVEKKRVPKLQLFCKVKKK